MTRSNPKQQSRKLAKARRAKLSFKGVSESLITHFPEPLSAGLIAGYSPIGDEIDIWPLLKHLQANGHTIALPVITAPETPLSFRLWTPETEMETDRFGVSYPANGSFVLPDVMLVPLLSFTANGERLGYGGGYYDRTLAALRESQEIFACGVAYARQEVDELPTDAYDQKLDGILTETGFRTFR